MSALRHARRLLADCRGAALVEFTVTLPVLLILFALIVEVGSVLRQHQIVTEGVRSAARYLSRTPDPSDAGAVAVARNLALTATTDGSGANRSAYWTDPASVAVAVADIDNSAGALRGPATLSLITVSTTVTVDVPLIGPMLRLVGGDAAATLDLNVVDQARHFGT
jgi:Flp pilus assembly protein TadG